MVTTDQQAIEEIVHEGRTQTTEELLDILERYHDDQPGVSTDAFDAYARELNEHDESTFDVERFHEAVEDRLTASESWVADSDRLYELGDGRISQYPAAWHDRLRGERDPATYLRFFEESVPSVLNDAGGERQRINEDTLIDVMSVVGELDRDAAKAAIESARDEGHIAEDADQHPKAGVYLTE